MKWMLGSHTFIGRMTWNHSTKATSLPPAAGSYSTLPSPEFKEGLETVELEVQKS